MLLFDAHLDMAWNALEWNRNLLLTVEEIRAFERQFEGIVPGECTVSWPELERGSIGVVIATLLPRLKRDHHPLTFPQSREAAYGIAYGQLHYYRAMQERGVIRLINDADDLTQHLAEWNSATPGQRRIGCILSMEGAPPILHPNQAAEWHAAGLRIVGPAHYGANEYCHGTGTAGGLTPAGRDLLVAMDQAGLLLDVTHLADTSFWEAIELFSGPVLASHHNCRALVPADRQLDDDQIRALIARDAVIGVAMDCWMLQPGWKIGVTRPDGVTLENVADHVDHVCQLAGNARHSGIGTDLDGGFGKEQSPYDLDTIANLDRLCEVLARRGYADDDIESIAWKNWVNFFQRAWSTN